MDGFNSIHRGSRHCAEIAGVDRAFRLTISIFVERPDFKPAERERAVVC